MVDWTAVGILAALIAGQFVWLRGDVSALRSEVAGIDRRVARLEGMLSVLQNAVLSKIPADDDTA